MRRDLKYQWRRRPPDRHSTLRCESVGEQNRIRYPGSPRRKRCLLGGWPELLELTRWRRLPGEYVARLKLKWIDGGLHKWQWSMWFNSMQREEPYLLLTSREASGDAGVPSGTLRTGAVWLSSARVVKCWVKSWQRAQPFFILCLASASNVGNSRETAGDKPEEGGDDVKSSWPHL